MDTQDLKKAKGHVLAVCYGFAAVLFITPLLGFALRQVPLEPKLFSIGAQGLGSVLHPRLCPVLAVECAGA